MFGDLGARLIERQPAHPSKRHDEQDDQERDEALDVGLAVDEPRISGVDEEPGMSDEGRTIEALEIWYASDCRRHGLTRPRHTEPPAS